MSNYGYFRISRQLLHNPLFTEFDWIERHIFLTLLENMAYSETTQNDHGVLIKVKTMQFLTTQRELADLCRETVPKLEKPKFNQPKIKRFLSKLNLIGFSTQELTHTKTLITITESNTCECYKKTHEPELDSRVTQDRLKSDSQNDNDKNEKNADKQETLKRLPIVEKVKTEKIVEESSVVSVSFSSHRESEEIEGLKAYAVSKSWDVSEDAIKTWVRYHGSQYVLNQFHMLAQNKSVIRTSEEKWLQTAMINDYWGKEEHRQKNYQAVIDLKTELGWHRLKINKSYCTDPDTKDDYQYSLPTDQLLDILSRKFEQKQEIKESGLPG